MSNVPASPQDFARLLQDRLIESGESRPLEFRVDLFGFVPRGAGVEQLFPLDNYYRHYLAAQGDGGRQQVVKQFVRDWQARWGLSRAPHAGSSFATQPPMVGGMPMAPMAGYRPVQRPKSNAGRILLVVLGMVGLLFCLMCVAPCALGVVMQNKMKNRPPNFAGPRGFPGLPPAPRLPQWQFQPPADSTLTEMLGGQGGGPRFYFDPDEEPVIGLAWSLDEWGGETALGSLQPLFWRAQVPEGNLGRESSIEWAREGYVLGGLEVDANHYVNGVKATWVKRDGDELDWTDTYESGWLGESTGRPTPDLGGDGTEIIGIALRQGLVVDSVGLILKQQAAQ